MRTTALTGSTARRGARICGVGAYRPVRVVGNDEIAARIGVTSDWIVRRSGIRERRYAGPDESLVEMGAVAAEKAVAAAGVDVREIDCVIAATITHLSQMPALAPRLAHRLGASGAAGFDLSAACAGFCHALALADDIVRAGTAEQVLVVGAERTTDILDRDDQTTAFLFADGAGAVVVGPAERPGIGPVVWGADGSRADAVGMTGYWTRELRDRADAPWPVIGMSGWRVFRWATEQLVPVVLRAIERAGTTSAELDAFVPHQANLLITEAMVRGLQLPERVYVARDIEHDGNTSAASIPLALERMLAEHPDLRGGTALLIGFGSGLVYASQVVELP